MATESALQLVTRLGRRLAGIVATVDSDELSRQDREILINIKQLASDARLDVRDFEMADSRSEMTENARAAEERLEQIRALILKGSESGFFTAIQVTELSVGIDAVVQELRV